MFGLISKREHDAVVADLAKARAAQTAWFFRWQQANAGCCSRDSQIADLERRLARFTSPRARDEKGRYLPEVRS